MGILFRPCFFLQKVRVEGRVEFTSYKLGNAGGGGWVRDVVSEFWKLGSRIERGYIVILQRVCSFKHEQRKGLRVTQINTNKEHHFLFSIVFDLKTSLFWSSESSELGIYLLGSVYEKKRVETTCSPRPGCLKVQSSSGRPGHQIWKRLADFYSLLSRISCQTYNWFNQSEKKIK